MEKSGFFNAFLNNGVYDRKYNANDYSDNLAVVISNGVLRSINDDLKVTASGMTVKIGAGRAWINGHYYYNDAEIQFSVDASTSGTRYDSVVLRLDNSPTLNGRKIRADYKKGGVNKEQPKREGDEYELILAYIEVRASEQSLIVEDQRSNKDVCGWLYSTSGDNSFFTSLDNDFNEWFRDVRDEVASVTLFKRYTWENTLTATTSTVQFNIPQYDPATCFIEVYVNGVYETDYTASGNVITFNGSLTGGTNVLVNCYKSIDGTGIESVSGEITQLQNKVAQIEGNGKFAYICTGLDDNKSLSQIAQAIYSGSYTQSSVTESAAAFLEAIGGNTYLGALASDAQIGIDVVGDLGATTPYQGTGTTGNPFKWFSLGITEKSDKRLIFDFAKCNKITLTCSANTTNYIFSGVDLDVRNININASSTEAGCNIEVIRGSVNTGRINFENCRLRSQSSGAVLIATHGTFTNCYGYIVSEGSTAYCFKPNNTGLIRLNGGEYYAFGATASGIGSAIIHVSASDSEAVLIANNLHCPVVNKAGYSQGFLAVANAGNIVINTVVSRLTSSGNYVTINNLISKNKA